MSKDIKGRFVETVLSRSIGNRQFIDDILSNTRSVPSLRDGAKVQAVLEAAVKSSTSGQSEVVSSI